MEEIAGSEDIAPGHFAAIGHHDADDALTLQAGSSAGETPLYLIHKAVHRTPDAAGLIYFAVRLRWRLGSNGFGQNALAERRRGSGCGRHAYRGSRATGNCRPNLGLLLVHGGLLADAGMHDGLRRGELRAATGPAAVLHAEDVEGQRFGANRHDAVFADDAILLAAAHEFAGQQ